MFRPILIPSIIAVALSPTLRGAQPAMLPPRGAPRPVATILNARRVNLILTPVPKVIYPGSPVLVSAIFKNKGKRKFEISGGPVRFTFNVIRAASLTTEKPATPTRCMARTPHMWNFNLMRVLFVPPGRARAFWTPINFAKYYDLTMPGKYRLQVEAGRLKSNAITVTVSPFPSPHAQPALAAVKGQVQIAWAASRRGLQLALSQSPRKAGSPLLSKVFLRCSGGHPTAVRLTDNPFLDWRAARVEGPDGINGDEIVKKPHPHWIPIPNKTPVPLTAYGRWLAKHAPKNLKSRIYTLKPGVVYEYAEPINLSCRFDMSLSGVYRARVRLAHSRAWSPWANITVPQN